MTEAEAFFRKLWTETNFMNAVYTTMDEFNLSMDAVLDFTEMVQVS